ncbi:DNA replication protein DnaD [Pullulanibacillus camelliae]|uniref:DNA replication protein DnaD n=2 Tax=Pullulanibacillus camelliae TaxID=1707096 RepID=A0A8J2VQZ6_9BACL|nr:DNA replication protein DnaD [Pullulanibacillus camelliae]
MIEMMTDGALAIPKLLLDSYAEIGLDEAQCMMILQIFKYIKEGNAFPTPNELAGKMSCDASQCSNHLRELVQRGFLDIVQEKDGSVYSESYSLEPLWNRLMSVHMLSRTQHQKIEQEDALYTIFEKEFGRPLSPMECESLTMWMDDDGHPPEIIKAALREAVISGKLNFRYIDRILFDWKKNGIQTLDQAKSHGEKVRGRFNVKTPARQGNEQQRKTAPFPMYNWLDN